LPTSNGYGFIAFEVLSFLWSVVLIVVPGSILWSDFGGGREKQPSSIAV
jgi:hypothetical protein